MPAVQPHPSSYRDPSGFVFMEGNTAYRQVNKTYADDYAQLMQSGLYTRLAENGWLLRHEETWETPPADEAWHCTLLPEQLSFISFPYEWSFDMLKDAALRTLDIALLSLQYGMMLKDASAYNLQLHKGSMVFIDTLSFERYNESLPWIAYRQFCEQFMAPLALMHFTKQPLQQMLLAYPDGIPLRVASKCLPWKSKWHLHTYLHLHLQAKYSGGNGTGKPAPTFSKPKLVNLLRSLRSAIQSYQLESRSGVWSGYYEEAHTRGEYISRKKELVAQWIATGSFQTAIDIGANEGEFSLLAADASLYTISADFDHYSVNRLYQQVKQKSLANIHPVVMDFSNPSPAIGVNNRERASFLERASSQLVMALALIHHLAIGKNIPFSSIATMFYSLGETLIVEYIPKEDEKIREMLEHKKDIYSWYSRENFLHAFSQHYNILASERIGSSGRELFLMKANGRS